MAKTKKAAATLPPVIIDITIGPPDPNPAHVKRGQPVIWKVNPSDALQISFHNGNSPLGWSQGLGQPGDGLRGTVRSNAAVGTYPYHPTLLTAYDVNSTIPGPVVDASDPEIVVDGGDRGGGRKQARPGARKSARRAAGRKATGAKKKVAARKGAKKKAAKKAARKTAKKATKKK